MTNVSPETNHNTEYLSGVQVNQHRPIDHLIDSDNLAVKVTACAAVAAYAFTVGVPLDFLRNSEDVQVLRAKAGHTLGRVANFLEPHIYEQ